MEFDQVRMLDCKVKEVPWSLLRGTMSPQYSWHMLPVPAKGSDLKQSPGFWVTLHSAGPKASITKCAWRAKIYLWMVSSLPDISRVDLHCPKYFYFYPPKLCIPSNLLIPDYFCMEFNLLVIVTKPVLWALPCPWAAISPAQPDAWSRPLLVSTGLGCPLWWSPDCVEKPRGRRLISK